MSQENQSRAGRQYLAASCFTLVICLGCLATSRVSAAPALERLIQAPDLSTNQIDQTAICTPSGMQEFLNHTEQLSDEDVELIYETCRDEFLQHNQVSPEVKDTVDRWVGTDLSKAELNQVFLIYQLALLGQRPEVGSEQFATDCLQMTERFETYRDTIEPLTSYIDVDLDAMLGDSEDEIDDRERDMLNYVQYTQFCKTIISQQEDENELALDNDLAGEARPQRVYE